MTVMLEMEYEAPESETEPSPELLQVVAWRRMCLERAGVAHAEASILAGRIDVDLHQALDLAERGCPSRLLTLILV